MISYRKKIDFYEINRNGTIRTIGLRLDSIPMTELDESADDSETDTDDEEFRCPYSIVDDRDYSILVVESILREGYVYFINKESFDVSLKFYPNYYHKCKFIYRSIQSTLVTTKIILGELEVPQSKTDETNEFDNEIDNCVNRSSLIPSAMNASIVRINNHIRVTVQYGGKYDYYEMNYRGFTCHAERELTEPINRTVETAVRECEKLVDD